jgi:hypothetical protein
MDARDDVLLRRVRRGPRQAERQLLRFDQPELKRTLKPSRSSGSCLRAKNSPPSTDDEVVQDVGVTVGSTAVDMGSFCSCEGLESGFEEKGMKARLLEMTVDGERVRDPTLLHHNIR